MSLPSEGREQNRRLLAQVQELQNRVHHGEARRLADLAARDNRRAPTVTDAIGRIRNQIVGRMGGRARLAPEPPDRSQLPELDGSQRAHHDRYVGALRAVDETDPASAPGATIEFAVWTDDLDEGRGDLFVALGLGQSLNRLGYSCRYTPRARWGQLHADSAVIVAMTHLTDPALMPPQPILVAWIRNQTDEWLANGKLALFDAVACSSQASADAVTAVLDIPVYVIPIGVDLELFDSQPAPGDEARDGSSVVATISQWSGRRVGLDAISALPGDEFTVSAYGYVNTEARAQLGSRYHGPRSFFALPGIYRSSAIVIDDFNATTAPYGNVNSRVFEALACGAFVVTSSARGLPDLGLADLEIYSSERDLARVLRDLLADPPALAERARALQTHVRRHHGWSQRAELFDQMVQGQL